MAIEGRNIGSPSPLVEIIATTYIDGGNYRDIERPWGEEARGRDNRFGVSVRCGSLSFDSAMLVLRRFFSVPYCLTSCCMARSLVEEGKK
jgi:hypothetical protein